LNSHTKYLGKRSSSSNIIVWTHTHKADQLLYWDH